MDRPDTHYVRSGEVYLASQVFGEGAVPVVVIPSRVHNVELIWEADEWERQAYFHRLAEFARVVVFDKRGTGASDRVFGTPTLEEQVDDVRAVMDAAGIDRALLLGHNDGAALAALFAATFPARVGALALWQPRVRGSWTADYPWGEPGPETPWRGSKFTSPEHIETGSRFQFPDRANDADFLRRYVRLLRLSTSPSAYEALSRMWRDTDLRSVLPAAQAPALVMHGGLPFVEESRYVAARLPDARMIDFPEMRVVAPYFASDPEPLLRAVEEFIGEVWDAHPDQGGPKRVLATVLFTDLVDSTKRAVELGPRWQQVLEAHNAAIRRQLVHFHGREVDTAGDGFFASGFDGPARAIRCGCAIRDALRPLDLSVRVGVHTGECDVVDGKLAGVTVAIGARIVAHAAQDEVLVSGTVRDLVAGSGIEFEPRGVWELRGIGEWPLYAVTGH